MFAVFYHFGSIKIYLTVLKFYKRTFLFVASAKNCHNAENKFLWKKWLYNIIIRSKTKALVRPQILILDEPTNGLDPVGINEIRTLIRSLPQKFDCTVLVSSHLLSEIELMADNIGILNHGHLLFEGTLDQLKFHAAAQGYPTDNLEDTFLALIDADNMQRGGVR